MSQIPYPTVKFKCSKCTTSDSMVDCEGHELYLMYNSGLDCYDVWRDNQYSHSISETEFYAVYDSYRKGPITKEE